MRILLFASFLLISSISFCQSGFTQKVKDSIKSISVNGSISLLNKGFAPIPAFSFNSPIAIGSLSVKKKRFSYDTDFALGLNGKPWMANNWFRFIFMKRKNIRLTVGINPFLF